ncbi:MAG: F0F1 ATP synthase subunit B [Roseobacter sp.]
MRRTIPFLTLLAAVTATPAFAAGKGISLANTDFVVFLGLVVFLGILVYFKVPSLLMGMLDKRAEGIQSELDEAKELRDEAQTLLASYERKQREVQEQADRIVVAAKEEARVAGEEARKDLELSLARRMAAAEDQIASAQAAAVKDVRDQAVTVAVAAAREVIAKQMSKAEASKLIDASIGEVQSRLH